MKLASFRVGQKETYGLKVEKGIVDLGKGLGALSRFAGID